jgi:integrase
VDVLLGRTAPSHLPTARRVLNRMATYFSDGQQDARSFPWHELTYAQVAELRTMLGRQYAPRTANNYLSTLKGVLREAKRLGLLDAASFDLLCDQPPVWGETLPAGRHVEADELELLFKYLGTLETASGARDRATFALLRGTGIRRAEATSLDLDAYQPFRSQLTVEHGKGRKERVVFLPAWVIGEVDDWLSWRGHDPARCSAVSTSTTTSTRGIACTLTRSGSGLWPTSRRQGSSISPRTTYDAPSRATCWKQDMTW